MMRIFFDCSAFAKRYVQEEGSEEVMLWCDKATELALAIIALP
jgi:predicted nucleic acid-binding protein